MSATPVKIRFSTEAGRLLLTFPSILAMHMQNLKLDLTAGQSVSLGKFRVTLVSTADNSATFEIEGPGGQCSRQVVPMNQKSSGQPHGTTSVTA